MHSSELYLRAPDSGPVRFRPGRDLNHHEQAGEIMSFIIINGTPLDIQPGANLAAANLAAANLRSADLSGADLSGADLSGANLRSADLSGADLSHVNLAGADLSGADLSGAYLRSAILVQAILSDAHLSDANLSDADLSGAGLHHAGLHHADLSGAILSGANLHRANLHSANLPEGLRDQLSIVPAGDVTGWKACRDGVIVKLLIPAGARRSNATTRKCRAEYADVLEVTGAAEGVSKFEDGFTYRAGERVTPGWFDPDWARECSGGIHFFLTREEAEEY